MSQLCGSARGPSDVWGGPVIAAHIICAGRARPSYDVRAPCGLGLNGPARPA